MKEQEHIPDTTEEVLCYQRTCPHCGKELYTVKLAFCPYCGNSLDKELPSADAAPAELREDILRLRQEYDDLEEELDQVQDTYTHLQESFDGLLSERNRLSDENTQLRRRLKEATTELQQWMLGSQGLNIRLKEVTEEGTAAKQEVQNLRRRLQAAEAQNTADSKSVRMEQERLQNELEALRYELRAKDKEMQKYRSISRRVPDLEQEKTLLAEMVSLRDAEIQRLRAIGKGKPNGSLHKGSVGEMRDAELLRTNIELKSEIFTTKEKLNHVTEELEAARDEIETLHTRRHTQEKTMQAQAEESARAIAAVQEEAQNQITALQEQLAAVQSERDELTEAAALRDKQLSRMEEELRLAPELPESGIEREYAELKRENLNLRETVKEQSKKLRSVTKQLLSLKNQHLTVLPDSEEST